MKKFFIILCITITMLCIIGCHKPSDDEIATTTGNEQTTTMANDTTGENTTATTEASATSEMEEELREITDEEYGKDQILFNVGAGDAKRLGVDKTLVWVMSEIECPSEATVAKFNELLVNKYGCDFVIEFRVYSVGINFDKDNYMYSDMVSDMMEMGHQADILYSGNYNDYTEFVERGVYVSLTDYFATNEGKELYEAYAPEIWKKTERGGHSYGYVSKIYPASMAVALCNEKIAAKYGIAVPTGEWSFYDVGEYLKKAGITQDNINDDEVLLACRPEALLLMEGYYTLNNYGAGIFFKQDETGVWSMVNPAAEADFVGLLKQVKEYADNGWYTCIYNGELSTKNKQYKNEQMGRFVFDFAYLDSSGILFAENKFVCMDDSICEVTAGKEVYGVNEQMDNMINGIASWSEYKDEAFNLITLIQTEAELSNLLEYGVEGVDYEYEDRTLKSLVPEKKIYLPTMTTAMSNINLLHSMLADPEDKLAYSKKIAGNFQDGPAMTYEFDMNEYTDQINKISTIYSMYEKRLFNAMCDDVEATIAEMGKELVAVGIDEVIAEFNSQMKGQ